MSHSSRIQSQNIQSSSPEYHFDNLLIQEQVGYDVVHSIIDQLITAGAKILHMKYIKSQIMPYASRTLARELVLNASWALEPIDNNDIFVQPDEDLDIPAIDEWASGVLPVRGSDSPGLRTSVTPQRELRRPTTTTHRARSQNTSGETNNESAGPASSRTSNTHVSARSPHNTIPNKESKKRQKPPPTEAQVIIKAFEEAKKKTAVTMKAVTVDSDFSVIQITEPKGLPPSLIVPKIGTKNKIPGKNEAIASRQNVANKRGTTVGRRQDRAKKKQLPKLLEPDTPVFDDVMNELSYSDKFVCAPGVTFKDGNVVKSRPPLSNAAQMTRQQYEDYLSEMKKLSD